MGCATKQATWLTVRILVFVASLAVGCHRAQRQPEDRGLRMVRGHGQLALVIGNAHYATPLTNPIKDARDTAVLLSSLGFTVMAKEDLDQLRLEQAIREFGDRLANDGGTGLFYYSGHGVQVDGENYLVPVGVHIEREDEVRSRAVPVDLLLRKLQNARNGTNIVILDACRDNPFRSLRSSRRGLAEMAAPSGTYVSYATAPGSVAADGPPGANGIYTGYMLETMRIPGLPIEKLFKLVRQKVIKATDGRQVPWDSSSLEGDFYFVPPPAPGALLCPAGTHHDGERCAMDVNLKCPLGTAFHEGRGCEALVLQLAPAGILCDDPVCTLGPCFARALDMGTAPYEWLKSVRLVPSVIEGKPSGIKLYAIRTGSVVEQIGLQNGDRLTTLNGKDISTPDQLLAMGGELRQASRIDIGLERRGQRIVRTVKLERRPVNDDLCPSQTAPPVPDDLPLPGEREFSECVPFPRSKKIIVSLKPESELEDLVGWYKALSCQTFIVPANLPRKKVTIIVPSIITVEEARRIFLGALESIGLTVQSDGRVLRIVESNHQNHGARPKKKNLP